jgi:hypothetical protein
MAVALLAVGLGAACGRTHGVVWVAPLIDQVTASFSRA